MTELQYQILSIIEQYKKENAGRVPSLTELAILTGKRGRQSIKNPLDRYSLPEQGLAYCRLQNYLQFPDCLPSLEPKNLQLYQIHFLHGS